MEWKRWSGAHLITPNHLGGFQDSGSGFGGGVLAMHQCGCKSLGYGAKRHQ